MLNIVVPMAGAGSRFASAGFKRPKPLIEIDSIPMIRVVIENLRPKQAHRFIFIAQEQHILDYALVESLSAWAEDSVVVSINGVTDGAARTVLTAAHLFDNDEPLLIANSDQYVDADIDLFLDDLTTSTCDGLIMTMKASDPKWSYVGFDSVGMVDRVVEKQVISDEATVGIYAFARGRDFVWAANSMIDNDDKSGGEFYVAPAYNYLIGRGADIRVHNVGAEGAGMYGLGTPGDLASFNANEVSLRAAGAVHAVA